MSFRGDNFINKLFSNVSTSPNSADLNAELTKRIELTTDKNCCQTDVSVSFRHTTKFSKGKTYLALFVSVNADT